MTADGTYRPGARVTTAAELEALPDAAVVLDNDGDAWQSDEGRWFCARASLSFWGPTRLAELAPLTVLFRPDAPQPAVTDDAVERLQRFTFDDPDVSPADEFVRLADVRAALAAAGAGQATGWPEQIARAVAAVRSEAASYEAVSRMGAESLYDDESDMPERMVDRLIGAGLIARPRDDTKAVRVGIAVEDVIARGGIPDGKVQEIRVAIEEAMR